MSNSKQNLEKYNKAFIAAKEMLNEKQSQAVEKIYGPVMTVAGPGTGKTQLLAVRIGNILQKTDINTNNILCLTFTESGSLAMRDRLKSFIGPEAYNANIFTFHSFCNYVIQENIQYFGGFRNLQLVSELELVDVYREIIDGFAVDNPLKRMKGNLYFETPRLKSLFNVMKQEGWTSEEIEESVQGLEKFYMEESDKFLVKRKQIGKETGKEYLKGEINHDKVMAEIRKFDGLIAAAKEIQNYDAILSRMERYDYNDMILWVINAFKENPDLLAQYQERFQFLLVDEYQDTNGSQNELLFLLADNLVDDQPNVFIVGDDDQSIFRFQGANMNNIIDFAEKYNSQQIVLDNNYRSGQAILDWSTRLIDHNEERLVRKYSHLTKKLIESRDTIKYTANDPRVWRFQNEAQEEIGIINDILKKQKEGVPLNEIAIIYRKHKNVENIVKYLTMLDIPLNIKRKVNILKEGEIQKIILLLRYIIEEYKKPFTGDVHLFELMHARYFGIAAKDIAQLSIYCSQKTDDIEDDRRWRTVICNEEELKNAGVSHPEPIMAFGKLIEEWIHDLQNETAQILFERILTKGGILDHILASEDKVWRLQMVNTFFNFIKDESSKAENTSMTDILDMVDKMNENKIEMPLSKIIFSKDGINFLTAHGSKGLEFQHVYMIKCNSGNWVTKNYGRNAYSYPETMVPVSSKSDVEDDRRLFYVAMTRAKDDLTISYPDFSDNEKALEPVRFIEEITTKEEDIQEIEVSVNDVINYKAELLRFKQGTPELIEHDLIDNILLTAKMSATSLNKYLRCPITYYYENILRVPMARGASNGFGNAIHYALEMYFQDIEKDSERKVLPVDVLQVYFKKGMKKYHSHFTQKERELSLIRGEQLIDGYYEKYHSTWSLPRKFELEFDIKTEFSGVPISGKIDQVAIMDDHLQVIDYKTGRFDPKKLKGPNGEEDPGGDYWRQIIFYKMLLKGDSRLTLPMRIGTMDFVEEQKEGGYKRRDFEVEDFEIDIVGKQLVDSWQKIKNHEFTEGCGEDECKWCNFVTANMTIDNLIMEEEDEL